MKKEIVQAAIEETIESVAALFFDLHVPDGLPDELFQDPEFQRKLCEVKKLTDEMAKKIVLAKKKASDGGR